MKQEEKYCGNCCWFCFECTDGEGQCAEVDNEGYPMMMTHCGSKACERFISRQQMRHHMAVLLQFSRWINSPIGVNIKHPDFKDIDKAQILACKYMKVFGKL